MTAPAPLRRDRRRRRTTVTGVLGEVLLTVGAVVLLYVAWQMWIGDLIIGAQRNAEAAGLSETWQSEAPASPTATPQSTPAATADATPTPVPEPATAPPVILGQPGDGEVFGVLHVPRWGPDYQVQVAGGVSREVTLDPIGIGHYPDTAMPGETGNFAVAGHRTTYGAPLSDLPSLRIGDAVVVETQDGWYTYRFRNIEYVEPTALDVLLPVPQVADVAATGSVITLTTCSPKFSAVERLIAYGVFESFTPRSSGSPTSLVLASGGA